VCDITNRSSLGSINEQKSWPGRTERFTRGVIKNTPIIKMIVFL
jgi:hypothetical protein